MSAASRLSTVGHKRGRTGKSLLFASAFSACVVACAPNSEFNQLHCKFNDSPRVSSTRVVTFVAANYVYAGDEDGTSASEYFNEAGTFIQGAYASTNEIFRDNHINLQIVPLDTLHIVDPSLAVLDASGLGGNPSIPYLERLTRVDSSNTQAIPVYWPEWINTPGSTDSAGFGPYVQCFSGQYIALDCSWVIVYGASLSNRTADITLAHELGHYFGLPHDNTDPNNLMNKYNPGTNLTQQQRDIVWQTVNTFGERLRLLSETCDLTPQPVVPVTPTLSSTPG